MIKRRKVVSKNESWRGEKNLSLKATKRTVAKNVHFLGAFSLVLGCLWYCVGLPRLFFSDHYYYSNEGSSSLSNNNKQHRNPWDSQLPAITPLFQTENPVILRRHNCIAKIQEHQLSTIRLHSPLNFNPVKKIQLLLVDPAYHGNVGDVMITAGEHQLLRRLGWTVNVPSTTSSHRTSRNNNNYHYQECHYVQANEFVPHCEEVINDHGSITQKHNNTNNLSQLDHKLAIWHGGGNWGDLWPVVHKLRIEHSFRALVRNYSVVGMPQSLYYKSKETESFDARLLKREIRVGTELRLLGASGSRSNNNITGHNQSVVLSWREYESYERAKQLYPFIKHLLLPDVAFQLGPYQRELIGSVERVDFLFLLRRDHESTLVVLPAKGEEDDDGYTPRPSNTTVAEVILDAVVSATNDSGSNKSFRVVDWPDRLRIFHSDDPFFTKTSIQLLSVGRVVICDRLHAAILAYLAGIPFVFIDPLTGKISKALRVAFDTWDGCRASGTATTMESLWYSEAGSLIEAVNQATQLLFLSA